jgi:hypothetical protein
MKLVHKNDAPRKLPELPEQLRRALETVRAAFDAFEATENPFTHLLRPDRPPFCGGASARSQRSAPLSDVVSKRRDRRYPCAATGSK